MRMRVWCCRSILRERWIQTTKVSEGGFLYVIGSFFLKKLKDTCLNTLSYLFYLNRVSFVQIFYHYFTSLTRVNDSVVETPGTLDPFAALIWFIVGAPPPVLLPLLLERVLQAEPVPLLSPISFSP